MGWPREAGVTVVQGRHLETEGLPFKLFYGPSFSYRIWKQEKQCLPRQINVNIRNFASLPSPTSVRQKALALWVDASASPSVLCQHCDTLDQLPTVRTKC